MIDKPGPDARDMIGGGFNDRLPTLLGHDGELSALIHFADLAANPTRRDILNFEVQSERDLATLSMQNPGVLIRRTQGVHLQCQLLHRPTPPPNRAGQCSALGQESLENAFTVLNCRI